MCVTPDGPLFATFSTRVRCRAAAAASVVAAAVLSVVWLVNGLVEVLEHCAL